MSTEGKMVKAGDYAPAFCLPDQDGLEVWLHEFSGKWVVLYFYQSDNSAGCTKEALDFTQNLKDFQDLGAEVLGISPDSPESHNKFIKKHGI